MSRNQRFALLGVAAILAVLAIVVLPGDDDDKPADEPAAATLSAERSTPEPSTADSTTTTETASAPKPKPKPPLLTAANPRQLTFDKGDTVRFRVRHDVAEEIHVHGYDISKDIAAGKTTTMSFKADLEGIFEIELEHSATPIGTIKVEPK